VSEEFSLKHLDLEVTNVCNLSCIHCSARAGKDNERYVLSIEDIKHNIQSAASVGLYRLGLTGGEPLSNIYRLNQIIAFCRSDLRLSLHIHLNGTLVTRDMVGSGGLLTEFEAISIPFLGGDSITHDTIAGCDGAFEKALKSSKILTEAGLPLTCFLVPIRKACGGFKKLAMELMNIGVRKIRPLALSPSGRARPNYHILVPSREELELFQNDLLDLVEKDFLKVEAGYCTRLLLPKLATLAGHERCTSGYNRLHINYKGIVYPCTASSGVEELAIGQIGVGHKDIAHFWQNSERLKAFRKYQETGLEECGKCKLPQKCKKGCIANNWGNYGQKIIDRCPLGSIDIKG